METIMLEKPRSRAGRERAEAGERAAVLMARLAEAIKRAKPAMDRITGVDELVDGLREGRL